MHILPARRQSAAWLWWLLPIVMIGGWYFPYLGLSVLACMLLPVLIAVKRGRHWCGWMCPRGAFYDYIMSRVSGNRPAPAWLRSKGFRLGAMAFLLGMMTLQLVLAWPNGAQMARVFIILLGVTTLVGGVLALLYTPRTWCTFCPMGTMASWVSQGKRPLQVAESCRNCQACAKVCPMGLTPHQVDAGHADCLKCTRCVVRCPVNALSFAQRARDGAEEQQRCA